MSMRRFARWLLAALCSIASAAWAQVASYDVATLVLSIPAVKVGSSTYVNVTLLNTGNFQFALQTATEQLPAGPGSATYDTSSSMLSIPAVKVGTTTFLDVTLLNLGSFNFALQTATELPAATLAEVSAFAAAWDAQWATAVPSPASARLSVLDSCYLSDGRTKPYLINDIDSHLLDYQQRDAYQIGRKSSKLQVLAMRNSVNADGTARSEIDMQYDIEYKDGSTGFAAINTIISGSSSGTPGCAAPQQGTAWRFFGNRQLIQTSVRSRNQRDERYSISTGAALSPAVNYRRDLQWQVTDPMGNASYVIVTGPGPITTVNGADLAFSLKFISPRLSRSAPELVGKNGNFLNWLDDDGFRYCRVGSGNPVASVADCAGQGATANTWGWTTSTPNAAADQGFANLGFVAGGAYTFAVYNDDGWKTINGHVGRTPIGTYQAVLEKLPHTFVEMGGTGVSADKFARMSFGGLSSVQVKNNLVSATPSPMNVSWNALAGLNDGSRFGLFQSWEYFQGARLGNTAGAFYPAYRYIDFLFPGTAALSMSGWPTTVKPADMASKTYSEYTLQFSDRNNRQILSLVSFQ